MTVLLGSGNGQQQLSRGDASLQILVRLAHLLHGIHLVDLDRQLNQRSKGL